MAWGISHHSFISAARRGDIVALQTQLRSGTSANFCDANGNTALIHAVRGGHVPAIRLLLMSGADVNRTNKIGETALLWACHYGDPDIVGILLEANASTDIKSKRGWTLQKAVYHGLAPSRVAGLLDRDERRRRNSWVKTGDKEVRHDTCLADGDIELTEIFNFETKERLSIVRVRDGAAVNTSHARDRFSQVDRRLMRQAAEVFKTGQPPADAVKGPAKIPAPKDTDPFRAKHKPSPPPRLR
jgi:ankyrin repeat protein